MYAKAYLGFTVPEVDKILSPYAEKSYKKYYDEILPIYMEKVEYLKEHHAYYLPENEQKLDSKACKNIRDIAARTQQPKPRELNFSEIGLFSFPLFLLLVLYQVLKDKDEIQVAEFFKVGNLLDTFEKYKDKFKVDVFLQKLVYYRLILDYYCIRQNADGFPYVLDDYVYDEDAAKDEGLKSAKKKLIQFQSMLFVSSTPVTYYRWLSPALEYIESSDRPISPVVFLNKLKQIDNDIDEHKGVPSEDALSSSPSE